MSDDRITADWYTDLFNTIHDADGEISQDLYDVADAALDEGEDQVDFDGHSWKIVDHENGRKDYAKVHAPLGGITVMGVPFRGGQFIPAGIIKKMSQDDKNVLFAKLAQQKGIDPTLIQKALSKSGKEDDQHRHKNIHALHGALKKSHSDDLDKALAIQGAEAVKHAGHAKHGGKMRAKLKDMQDMKKMGQSGVEGGAGGGAAVTGPEQKPQIVVTQAADGYEAKFGEFAATGTTPEEAVGALMKEHGEKMGLPVAEKPKQYQYHPEVYVTEQALFRQAIEAMGKQPQHTHIHLPDSMKMEIPTPNVVVNVPEQTAPVVNVAAAVTNVTVEAPTVNLAPADVKVITPAPIVNVNLPMPVATEKEVVEWVDAEKTIPKKIRETPVERKE